jgi:hypothetical protein
VNALKTGFGNEIEALTEDSGGNLYVASCDLGVVLKIDSSSNTTVYAGTPLAVGPVVSTGVEDLQPLPGLAARLGSRWTRRTICISQTHSALPFGK